MPDINETGLGHTPQTTVHNTKSILPVNGGNVKGICSKVCLFAINFCLPSPNPACFTRWQRFYPMIKWPGNICGHGGIGRLGGFRFHCESVQVRVLLPAPNKKERLCLSFLFGRHRTRTHVYASVRLTLAATSSKTGGYIYFSFPSGKRKKQIESCCPPFKY